MELVVEVARRPEYVETGARLTRIRASARFRAAPVPALRARATGWAPSPISFSDSSGAPGRRRTSPPSWSVIISSGARTGLDLRAFCRRPITPRIWPTLEMLF